MWNPTFSVILLKHNQKDVFSFNEDKSIGYNLEEGLLG